MRRSPPHTTLLLLLLPALAGAQGPDAPPPGRPGLPAAPSVLAARARSSLRVDGRLDEADWAVARPADGFTQRDPEEGKPASEPTDVRVLFDGEALYVGARLFDRDPSRIRARLARRDGDTDSDLFQVSLDSFHDRLTAWLFQVNPAGAILDAAVYADGSQDDSWDGVWEAAAVIDSLGWTAEMRIPFSQLHYNEADGAWGIQLFRLIHRKQESDYFAFSPKKEEGGVSRYGTLTGLDELPSKRHLEVLPYVIGRGESSPAAPGDPFRDGHDYSGSAGLDLKYGLSPDLTLSAAVNPDFGQAEVDPAVVNLSAFETFYPEKRPFFVSDAGNFSFGSVRTMNNFGFGQTFYTRRIGRPPHRQLDPADYRYLDEPADGTIAAAAKLTGKTRSGLTVGLLEAVTTRETAHFVNTDGSRGQAPVEPATNFLVTRLRKDFRGGDTQAGLLVTGVQRDLADSTLRSTLHSSAWTAGFDWNHAWSKRSWSFDGFLLGSLNRGSAEAVAATQRRSAHYYQRPDASHLEYDPARTSLAGYHGEMALARSNGEHWLGSVMTQVMSPGFDVNDLGFMNRADRYTFTSIVMYQENEPGRLFRRYNVYPFTYHAWNYGGKLITGGLALGASSQLANYWSVDSQLRYSVSTFDDRLTRGGPLARTPEGRQGSLTIGSDSRRAWTLETSGTWYADDHGGRDDSYSVGVSFHPSPGVQVQVGPAWEYSRSSAQYVMTQSDPTATGTYGGRYVFANLVQRAISLETRLNCVFSPKISLQLYMQPLVSSGLYRDFAELHAPETFDFDVYGREKGTITRDGDGVYTVDPDGAGAAPAFQFGDPNFNFRSLRGNAVLRWEYRPGSTFYLIWQQDRSDVGPEGDFVLHRDLTALGHAPTRNILMAKVTTWLGL